MFHGGVEIEVGKVNGHELGIWGRDDAVEKAFDCGDVCGGSADFAGIVNAGSANGEAGAFGFLLFRTNCTNIAEIGGFAVGRHGSVANEEDDVGTFATVTNTLGEATDLICTGTGPYGSCFRISTELAIVQGLSSER